MVRFGGSVRAYADGSAVPDGTDVVITDAAGATVTTLDTADGLWEYQANLNAKGQLDAAVVVDGMTRVETSRAPRQVGPISVAELVHVAAAMGNGVVADYEDELAVTATGTRSLAVAPGAALVAGVPCVVYATANPAAAGSANASGSTRSDCLVLRVVKPGYDETEGKSELVIVEGSADAPADTDQYAYLRLASMTLANGGTSYTVTDRRTYLLDTVALASNEPTQAAVGRSTASQSVTTSESSVGPTASVTLTNGVAYDVVAEAFCQAEANASGVTVSIAPYIGTTGNRADFQGHNITGLAPIANAHYDDATGTGAAVECGIRAVASGGFGGTVARCVLTVTAIPRPA